MRPTDTHIAARARQVIAALCICISLSAQVTDRDLFDAYLKEDMSVWKEYIDNLSTFHTALADRQNFQLSALLYEYGYCGYIVSADKEAAKPYVRRFKEHIEAQKTSLPKGHYEMWMSAVLVFELRLKESIHPIKAMSLAKEATKLAPNDPVVLSYYGTCLFYAPKPFGSKAEALEWFEAAQARFGGDEWKYSWLREANEMYINQCREKLKK